MKERYYIGAKVTVQSGNDSINLTPFSRTTTMSRKAEEYFKLRDLDSTLQAEAPDMYYSSFFDDVVYDDQGITYRKKAKETMKEILGCACRENDRSHELTFNIGLFSRKPISVDILCEFINEVFEKMKMTDVKASACIYLV